MKKKFLLMFTVIVASVLLLAVPVQAEEGMQAAEGVQATLTTDSTELTVGDPLKTTKTSLLISGHDFKKTPSLAELKKKLDKMSKFSSNVKIVTTAKSTDDATRVLQLYSKKEKINLIAFAMGDSGRISRILSLYLGSPYSYVSLGKPVAPGQFSVDEVNKIINLKK